MKIATGMTHRIQPEHRRSMATRNPQTKRHETRRDTINDDTARQHDTDTRDDTNDTGTDTTTSQATQGTPERHVSIASTANRTIPRSRRQAHSQNPTSQTRPNNQRTKRPNAATQFARPITGLQWDSTGAAQKSRRNKPTQGSQRHETIQRVETKGATNAGGPPERFKGQRRTAY